MSENKPSIHQIEQAMADGFDVEIRPGGEVHIRDAVKDEKAERFLSGLADLKAEGEHY